MNIDCLTSCRMIIYSVKHHKNRRVKSRHDLKSKRLKIRHVKVVKARNRFYASLAEWRVREIKQMKQHFWDYEEIRAPKRLSLIENPEEVLKFISLLTIAYEKRKKVYVHLRDVNYMTNDALVLLLSNVAQFKDRRIDFNGDRPLNSDVARRIEKSGFYKILYAKKKLSSDTGAIDLTSYSTNSIFTHAQKNVDSELTASLIASNSHFLWGQERRCQGVQRVFIELMQNTNNHASHTVGGKYWWISVSKKENPKTICFSFIDYGMGVFKSLSNKQPGNKFYGWADKIRAFINPDSHSSVLESLLSGKFHSTVTNNYFRGKGLPGIYREYQKGSIRNLIVVTNDAYADTQNNIYKPLSSQLDGTFVYFEVDSNCRNCVA